MNAKPKNGQEAFPIGAKVELKVCPATDEVGEVTGYDGNRVVVYWPLWSRESRYRPDALVLVNREVESSKAVAVNFISKEQR